MKRKQDKVKQYTDARRNAKSYTLQPGDLVWIKKPWKVRKGDQKFTQPRSVVQKRGEDSYLLDDGKIWNASRLAGVPEPRDADTYEKQQSASPILNPPSVPFRCTRIRQKPIWTK